MYKFVACIVRLNEINGPGIIKIVDVQTKEQKYAAKCITGGNITDAHEYGGLTPPLQWMMIEEIKLRKHPNTKKEIEMARIIPIGKEKNNYNKRSYGIDDYPFMIHQAGISTGCIAILPEYWDAMKKILNEAFREGLLIEVV